MSLSIIMITRNTAEVVGEALASVEGLWSELVVGDAGSTDGTLEILKQYNATIIAQEEGNLGKRKQELVKHAKGEWILVLDSDERVSQELRNEIKNLHDNKTTGYRIPYQNYVFGRPVYYGGERYSKIRIFRNKRGRITTVPIHEEIKVEGSIGELHGVIHHHSYRTPSQLFGKFTRYAVAVAKEKRNDGERVSLKQLCLNGPHMFWVRYIEEKGYKDGMQGFILAFAFAYMESLTYMLLCFKT